jgi:hypothetical protein
VVDRGAAMIHVAFREPGPDPEWWKVLIGVAALLGFIFAVGYMGHLSDEARHRRALEMEAAKCRR